MMRCVTCGRGASRNWIAVNMLSVFRVGRLVCFLGGPLCKSGSDLPAWMRSSRRPAQAHCAQARRSLRGRRL